MNKINLIKERNFPFHKLTGTNPVPVSYEELDFRTCLIGMFLKVHTFSWDFYIPAINGSLMKQGAIEIILDGYIVAVKND